MILTPALLLPADEAERLQTFYDYDLLPSLQETVFDELVELTARLFGMPIAYVGLVDAHEMHYKATCGFAVPLPQPRAELLCAVVVKQGQVVVYNDLATTAPTPLDALALETCRLHQVRFYAGAPVRMPDQRIVGTLCLVGPQPRAFYPEEVAALVRIAGLVSQAIALRHHYRTTPGLGAGYWQDVQAQLGQEVFALGALVRYLLARYGTTVPVVKEVLQPVMRQLDDLFAALDEGK